MLRDAILIGGAIGLVLAAIFVVATALLDSAFVRRVDHAQIHFWVRGDAGFQRWFTLNAGRRTLYGRRMLLVVRDQQLAIIIPFRTTPAWSTDYAEIERISTEAFRSRSVRGRGVRITLESGSSCSVRPELLWLPSILAPSNLADDLATTIAAYAQRAKSTKRIASEPASEV